MSVSLVPWRRPPVEEALDPLSDSTGVLLVNERSGRPAVQVPAPSFMLDDGEIERRVRLIRPMEQNCVPLKMMAESHWAEADRQRFTAAWRAELYDVPEFSESTSMSSPAYCCRSGNGCQANPHGSTAFRRMPVKESLVARFRPLGSRTSLRPTRPSWRRMWPLPL